MTGSDFASDDADSEPFFARYRELITAVNAAIGCRLLQTAALSLNEYSSAKQTPVENNSNYIPFCETLAIVL